MAHGDGLNDMYGLLGVPRDADVLTIRRGYRELARAFRLDVSRRLDSGERLRELTHAYAVLTNPSSRLLYDGLAAQESANPQDAGNVALQLRLRSEELFPWVFGANGQEGPRAAPRRKDDLLLRSISAALFVIALLLLVVLLRG